MNILEEIKQEKLKEVQIKKELYPHKLLERSVYFDSEVVSLKRYLSDPLRSGIIAEFKRRSPSKGLINEYANAQQVTLGYMQAGAAALSVLTDEKFFGAKKEDLSIARKYNYCPILRKDFIVDEYQLLEAKSLGADAILLIAKMLSPHDIKQLAAFAKGLGLEVFLEFHTAQEIEENEQTDFDLAGINNRNLNSFDVDIENSIRLAGLLPKDILKVAESGIESAQTVKTFKQNGFTGFLIGEYFMRNSDPAAACKEFIKQLAL